MQTYVQPESTLQMNSTLTINSGYIISRKQNICGKTENYGLDLTEPVHWQTLWNNVNTSLSDFQFSIFETTNI